MAGILDKLSLLVRGNFHALLDSVIDLNSPAAVKQRIRQLETAQAELNEALAQNNADIVGARRQRDALQQRSAVLESNATLLVGQGKDDAAQRLLAQQVQIDQQVDTAQRHLDDAEELKRKLLEVKASLDAQHDDMLTRLHEIEVTERTASAEDRAARAIVQVGSLTGAGSVSVDDVAARAQRRLDVADARLGQAMAGVDSTANTVRDAEAADRLAQLKAKLAQKSAAAT